MPGWWRSARPVARAGAPREDEQLRQLLAAGTPVICIFGKSWDLHVTHALRITLEENLRLIEDSVAFLVDKGVELIFDAEHFFDGYRANAEYALATVQAAVRGGAHWVVLCDTNGGSLTEEVRAGMRAVRAAHVDPAGHPCAQRRRIGGGQYAGGRRGRARMVHGTINGYGERCGNANLCSILPSLELKMGYRTLPEGHLPQLYATAHFVAEVANVHPPEHQPYIGKAAFAHKGGVHIDSVLKEKRSYEHVRPESVGNTTRLLVSDQSGASSVVERAQRLLGLELDKKAPITKEILARLKEAENEGYEFEAAEASFELLLRRCLNQFTPQFVVTDFRVIAGGRTIGQSSLSEAIVRVKMGEVEAHTVADGDGPVHALDSALRKALEPHFPQLQCIHLTDFKVRVVNVRAGTAARVRVLVETTDENGDTWSTIGVHENIILASLEALCDCPALRHPQDRLPAGRVGMSGQWAVSSEQWAVGSEQ